MERTIIPGTDIEILGSTNEIDEKLARGEISLAEHEKLFAESRKHGLLGDVHPFAIGGSDTAAILGLSPWKLPSTLAKEKLGMIKPEARINNSTQYNFDRGHCYESGVRAIFEVIMKNEHPELAIKVENFSFQCVNRKWPHCVANIDGLVYENGKVGILEIKTTDYGSGTYKDFFELEEIPPYYLSQVVFYMEVMNLDFAYIVCAKDFSRAGIKYIRISRSKEYGLQIMNSCEEYVENVSKGIIPDDSIVESETLLKKEIRSLTGPGDPALPPVIFDSSLKPVLEHYKSIKEEIEKCNDEITSLEESIADDVDSYMEKINDIRQSISERKSELEKKIKSCNKDLEKCSLTLQRELGANTKGILETKDYTFTVDFPAIKSDDYGKGAKAYLKANHPEIVKELSENCPANRNISVSICERVVEVI